MGHLGLGLRQPPHHEADYEACEKGPCQQRPWTTHRPAGALPAATLSLSSRSRWLTSNGHETVNSTDVTELLAGGGCLRGSCAGYHARYGVPTVPDVSISIDNSLNIKKQNTTEQRPARGTGVSDEPASGL